MKRFISQVSLKISNYLFSLSNYSICFWTEQQRQINSNCRSIPLLHPPWVLVPEVVFHLCSNDKSFKFYVLIQQDSCCLLIIRTENSENVPAFQRHWWKKTYEKLHWTLKASGFCLWLYAPDVGHDYIHVYKNSFTYYTHKHSQLRHSTSGTTAPLEKQYIQSQ